MNKSVHLGWRIWPSVEGAEEEVEAVEEGVEESNLVPEMSVAMAVEVEDILMAGREVGVDMASPLPEATIHQSLLMVVIHMVVEAVALAIQMTIVLGKSEGFCKVKSRRLILRPSPTVLESMAVSECQ